MLSARFWRVNALAPADPRTHEALAKIHTNRDWWDLAPSSDSDVASEISGAPADLASEAEKLTKRFSRSEKARNFVVQHLTQTLRRPTAHERMDALLDARQVMRDTGISPALASEIVGEVERAMAV